MGFWDKLMERDRRQRTRLQENINNRDQMDDGLSEFFEGLGSATSGRPNNKYWWRR